MSDRLDHGLQSGIAEMPVVAVVIPCYRVTQHIVDVIERIGPECQQIYVVDDCCPDNSGEYVRTHCTDSRVRILRNQRNLGVGGAVMAGYEAALKGGADILVKIDGDGQMPPELLRRFVAPILSGVADYTKGNRFYDLSMVRSMPTLRLLGNAALSFMSKFSSGYWDVFDPTNGYTAIHRRVAAHLPLDRISRRYFFESDMLFRLNTLRAMVVDVPMAARYNDEVSNLKISRIFGEFFWGHARNFAKRIFYNYFLRDLSAASLQLVLGALLMGAGATYGLLKWFFNPGNPATAGTVMLAALPIMLGLQLVLAFLMWDMQSVPRMPVHPRLPDEPDVVNHPPHPSGDSLE
ncbi:glycosyltransferase family 2 protein [Lysobacter koreensis]|uniref:Glycosyltransferase family 2 protein n=1 Tax=Lysobacter koreensis TaxID=266122 RepID=A0ABW2YLJ7_9GAMM